MCCRVDELCLEDQAAFTGKVSSQECGTALDFYEISSNGFSLWERKIKSIHHLCQGMNYSVTTQEPEFKSHMSHFNLWPFNPLLPVHPIGQLISATTEEIVKAYYPSYFLLSVAGQIQTRQVHGSYDDSYLGEEAHLDNRVIKIQCIILAMCMYYY